MIPYDPVTDLESVAAALLLFEAFHAAGLVRRGRPVLADALWLTLLLAVVYTGHEVAFGGRTCFLPVVASLCGVSVLRAWIGAIDERTGMLERWRYAFPAVYGALLGDPWGTAGISLILALNRRDLRGLLLLASRVRGPFRLSSLEVDHILPPAVTYDRPRGEKGFTLVETIVSMTLLAIVSMGVLAAAAGRAVRLRQVEETAVVREAAVSELERALSVPFAALAGEDGREFPLPGGEPGRVRVDLPEEGLARITVTAPRRGAAPVRLETWRTRRAP